MTYIQHYASPFGDILLAADKIGLTALWFVGQKYFARDLSAEHVDRETPVLTGAKRWLDIYFTGMEPDFLPPLHPQGSKFRLRVWEALLKGKLPRSWGFPVLRPWAARWDTTKSPSSFPVTGSLAQTAA